MGGQDAHLIIADNFLENIAVDTEVSLLRPGRAKL
jgi:hypothetical protein